MTKEDLILEHLDWSEQNGHNMGYDEAREDIDNLLVQLGTPVKYYRSAKADPYSFCWRRVGNEEIREFDNDDSKVEITEEQFKLEVDLHELGLD